MTAATMSETELLQVVLETASLFRWRTLHLRPARTAAGWRTAVSGDGAGFPDVLAVRGDRIIAAELKSNRGRLTDLQEAWLEALRPVADVFVWRPESWLSGEIQRVLRGAS
jgi:Holliday junction resolvase